MILAHDCNGRPLKAGDKCICVGAIHRENDNVTLTVLGPAEMGDIQDVIVDRWNSFLCCYYRAWGHQLKKITDDHKPADESFGDMVKGLRRVSEVA